MRQVQAKIETEALWKGSETSSRKASSSDFRLSIVREVCDELQRHPHNSLVLH